MTPSLEDYDWKKVTDGLLKQIKRLESQVRENTDNIRRVQTKALPRHMDALYMFAETLNLEEELDKKLEVEKT